MAGAVFEEMDSEDTVVMIRTRMPYNGGGITFKFSAAKITTMEQVHEMSTISMIKDIASKLDGINGDLTTRITRWAGKLSNATP